MSTAGDLVTEAVQQLHGFGGTQDRITTLAQPMGATDSTFLVDYTATQALGVTAGEVEIDGEILLTATVDPNSNTVTVARNGRGYKGTTAASHSAGAKVITRPRFPRYWVLKQINEVIGGLFPDIFALNTYTTTVSYPNNTYTLPGSPQFVVDAQWQDPIGRWQKCFSYTLDAFDGTFRLGDGAMIGRPLRVIYASEPVAFTAETDNFAASGLPDSCQDLLILGAVAKIASALDISRAQINSVEQAQRAALVPPGTGQNAAKWLMANFEQRLTNESESLKKLKRPRVVRSF